MFITMLTYAENSSEQRPQPPQTNYQQYTTIPGHYINNMYPYMQMGGQVWGYGNGINPNWNRQ
jgi:hypothetical protein